MQRYTEIPTTECCWNARKYKIAKAKCHWSAREHWNASTDVWDQSAGDHWMSPAVAQGQNTFQMKETKYSPGPKYIPNERDKIQPKTRIHFKWKRQNTAKGQNTFQMKEKKYSPRTNYITNERDKIQPKAKIHSKWKGQKTAKV